MLEMLENLQDVEVVFGHSKVGLLVLDPCAKLLRGLAIRSFKPHCTIPYHCQSYLVEWSSEAFGDYVPTTSTITVNCAGEDGTATGNFRLKLNTEPHDQAAVQVGPYSHNHSYSRSGSSRTRRGARLHSLAPYDVQS